MVSNRVLSQLALVPGLCLLQHFLPLLQLQGRILAKRGDLKIMIKAAIDVQFKDINKAMEESKNLHLFLKELSLGGVMCVAQVLGV